MAHKFGKCTKFRSEELNAEYRQCENCGYTTLSNTLDLAMQTPCKEMANV